MRTARPTQVEWLAILVLVCAVTAVGVGHALLGRIDATLYDAGLALWRRQPPQDIVLVVADEESIAALGRWPWRRAIHATLVEKLAAAKPKAIALDIIITEPDTRDPNGDELLARQMASAGNVVVVSPIVEVAGAGPRDVAPIESVRAAAAALAHVQVETDVDGVVRAVPLMDGAQALRPYLGLAALAASGRPSNPWPGREQMGGAGQGMQRYLIPFFGPDGTMRRYSYLAVLRGDVPVAEFAGKTVFVGTAAAGLGDEHVSPGGGRTAPMAGVEIAAQIAGALQEGARIRAASPWQVGGIAMALVLAVLLLYRVLQPRTALAVTGAALVLVLAGSFLAFRLAGVWMPPSAALLGVSLCYPLWSWRRLEAALRYMRGELERLRAEPDAVPPSGVPRRAGSALADPVDATIAPLEEAIAGLRDARRFIADTVESLPQALFVADAAGQVVLANSLARQWAVMQTSAARRKAGIESPESAGKTSLAELLLDFRPGASRTWESIIDESFTTGGVVQIDARGPGDRDVIVIFSPRRGADGVREGLIVNMVDVSAMREAERRRDDLLRVLSHDMRSPQAAIITLIETHGLDPNAIDTSALIARVGGLARRTLDLADDFLRLARAEQARAEQFVELDLADVITESCEEAWTPAQARSIVIERSFEVEEALVLGDRSLLLRMMQNLLDNAIKYSPPSSAVRVSLESQGISWLVRVTDRGRGIAKQDLHKLFTRFGRVGSDPNDPGGVGLGLVMVRTVVERHRGVVSVASEPGQGSTFSVSLPALRRPREAG